MPKNPEPYDQRWERQSRYDKTDKGKARKAAWRAKNRQKMRDYARRYYQEKKASTEDPS